MLFLQFLILFQLLLLIFVLLLLVFVLELKMVEMMQYQFDLLVLPLLYISLALLLSLYTTDKAVHYRSTRRSYYDAAGARSLSQHSALSRGGPPHEQRQRVAHELVDPLGEEGLNNDRKLMWGPQRGCPRTSYIQENTGFRI